MAQRHGIKCPCMTCYTRYENQGMTWDADKQRYVKPRGGTMNSTVFETKPQRNDPDITNHYFNGPGDGAAHGHVKERRNEDGTVSYPFVRDVEGDVYDTE